MGPHTGRLQQYLRKDASFRLRPAQFMTSCTSERQRRLQLSVGGLQGQECATPLAERHAGAGHKQMFNHLMTFSGE